MFSASLRPRNMKQFIFQHEGFFLFFGDVIQVLLEELCFVWLSGWQATVKLAGSVSKGIVEVPSLWCEVALSALKHVA